MWIVFPTLVGVVRTMPEREGDGLVVFPTLVGVVRKDHAFINSR